MKERKFNNSLILIESLFVFLAAIIIGNIAPREGAYYHIGIAVYNMDDTYMQEYLNQLQPKLKEYYPSGKKVVYEILDAEGDSNRQQKQLEYMFSQNYDVLLLNLVEPALAASILNKAADLNIPVILFNRETELKNMTISDAIWYVGTDSKAAGAIQGEMLVNLWEEQKKMVDYNGNGKIDYILVEGEETHFDTIRRTNGFLETSSDIPLNQLTNLLANWKREAAYEAFCKLDKESIAAIEVVVCHNDDMALGIYDFYKKNQIDVPIILGINNHPEMNEKILEKEIYGTVDNDIEGQVSYMCDLLDSILQGQTGAFERIWYSKPYAIEVD